MRLLIVVLVLFSETLLAARIKDLAMLRGSRLNQLVGYGLVVGLAGTGDKANELTQGSIALMLQGLGIDLKSQKIDTKNAAAVIVSATLQPFTRLGTQIDVTISSIGSANSLEGGTLLMSSLKGPDGKVYAMAQGKVAPVKKAASGGGGGQQKMVTAVITNGAILEREVVFDFSKEKDLKYFLASPDFTTAVRMARRINEELGGRYATAMDPSTIEVIFPYHYDGTLVELAARLEGVDVEADRKAKIVINARTGTVVLGESVRIAPVAIAHANLKVEVSSDPTPPAGGAERQQRKADDAAATGATKSRRVMVMQNGSNIAEVVSTLNEMGATPDDLITLLQSIKAAGALMAELEMQ